MIDPFDAALSEFIDSLPEEPILARRLLEEAAPFSGRGDLPELAELATAMRSSTRTGCTGVHRGAPCSALPVRPTRIATARIDAARDSFPDRSRFGRDNR